VTEEHVRELLSVKPNASFDIISERVTEALLPRLDMKRIIGLSDSNVDRRLHDPNDDFPRPVCIDGRRLWLLTEVLAWIARQKAKRDAASGLPPDEVNAITKAEIEPVGSPSPTTARGLGTVTPHKPEPRSRTPASAVKTAHDC
jgi:predicted DNA-binding transcriptional regulator AlpA